jgi:hypothetical protein
VFLVAIKELVKMQSVWLSLLWKEWCEFRWKLVALTVSFVVGQAILTSIFINDPWPDVATVIVESTQVCLVVYAVLAGAFVGMSVSAGENSNRTMRFTQALPIPMWQAAAVRILVGAFTVVVPILCVMLFVWAFAKYLWGDQLSEVNNHFHYAWNTSSFFTDRALSAVLGVSSLLLWTSVCGVNRSDEVRAGAIAFLVCAVLWGLWFYGIEENYDWWLGNILEALSVALPGGPAFGGNFRYGSYTGNIPLLASITIISHGLLLVWFVTRYGKSSGRSYSGGKQFITDWFRFRGPAKPFRSQGLAIIWKQVREMGPLAFLAVGGILAFMAFTYVADDPSRWQPHDWSNLLGGLTLVVGGFVTLVSGIGMIYEDYSRGLPNFWRSRPINLHQWFFLKYTTGILVLVVAFVPLVLISAWLGNWRIATKSDVAMFVLIFLTLYAGSLAAYALVRQPIYAVVLTIAGIWFTPGIVLLLMLLFPYWEYNKEQFMFIILALQLLVATFLAWLAVVRDWGWKRHR